MSDTSADTKPLFRFIVPGLPDVTLALAHVEVLEILPQLEFTPVPFSPAFVIGLGVWHTELVTLVDMAAALWGAALDPNQLRNTRYLIAQSVIHSQRQVIAIPVLQEVGTVEVPAHPHSNPLPEGWRAPLMRAALQVDASTLYLLRLEGLAEPAMSVMLTP
jgi:chemotaxis signal transduction protein